MDFAEFTMLVETLEAMEYEEEYDEGTEPSKEQFFAMIDADGDGLIKKGEVDAVLDAAVTNGELDEPTAKFLSQFVSFWSSKTWKGKLSLDNFLALASQFEGEPSEKTMQKFLFSFIDGNNNGFLQENEVKKFLEEMAGLSGEELDGAMQFVGQYVGRDEFMDFREFKKLLEDVPAK